MSMLRNSASAFRSATSMYRFSASTGVSPPPALRTRLTLPSTGMFGVTTDWHRFLIVAVLNAETATGCIVFLPARV
jgi:hypothetical protein